MCHNEGEVLNNSAAHTLPNITGTLVWIKMKHLASCSCSNTAVSCKMLCFKIADN